MMYPERNIIEMVELYNCLRLDNKYVFQVEVYKKENDNMKFFEIGNKKYQFESVEVGQLTKLISREGKFKDSEILNLWKVNVDKNNLNLVSTEEGIKQLGGELMKSQQNFVEYFPADYVPDVNIHIVVVIATTTTMLGIKRPIMEEENLEQNRKKWETNGAIQKLQHGSVYFADPLSLSGPLLNKIRNGEFVALYGPRAFGKTTRVFRVMEQLEEEGYFCLYVTLEQIEIESKKEFWSSFGNSLFRQNIKNQIKSGSEFAHLFSASEWRNKKVVLFIDEYDILYTASDDVKTSFLRIICGIKARKEEYAIWSINAVGSFSILYLSSNLTTSQFNEPFQNPNFTQEQVQILFKEFANKEGIIINPEIIEDIYMRTNGHAGLVCLCGKAINLHLIKKLKKLDESLILDISTWLNFTTNSSLEEVILCYSIFRMIKTLATMDSTRPAVDLLQSSFIGFLDRVSINDSDERRLALLNIL